MIAHPLRSAYLTCSSICSSVRSGRYENVPCVILIDNSLSRVGRLARRRGGLGLGLDVRRVGGLELEGHVAPDLERGLQLGIGLGVVLEDVGTLVEPVAALV